LKINPNYEKEENYKPHLFNFQLLQNLWSTSQNFVNLGKNRTWRKRASCQNFSIVFSIWRQLGAWRWAWKEVVMGKKRYVLEDLKTPLHHTWRGVISLFEFKRGRRRVDLVKRLDLHNPNQFWSTYGSRIQDSESVLAIFCPGIFNLEKEDKEPHWRPLDLHEVPKCLDLDCGMPTCYYLKGR
jgi:hypothetical protein